MKAGASGEIVDLAGYLDAREGDQQQQMKQDSFIEGTRQYTWHQGVIPQQGSHVQGAQTRQGLSTTKVSHEQEKQISGLRRLDLV